MSDTPRTDAAIISANGSWCFELRDLCRELERELEQIKRNEYICPRCLLRQGDTHPKGDF